MDQATSNESTTSTKEQPSGAQSSGARTSGAQGSGAQGSGAQASGAQASGAQASGAQASGAQASGAQASGPIFIPPCDVLEKGNTVIMLVDLPGADPASLDVTLDKRMLTITAKVTSSVPEGYAPAYIEFQDGTYQRRFTFSDQMDGEHIEARLKDGVLRLTVPKAPDTGAKKITVKAA